MTIPDNGQIGPAVIMITVDPMTGQILGMKGVPEGVAPIIILQRPGVDSVAVVGPIGDETLCMGMLERGRFMLHSMCEEHRRTARGGIIAAAGTVPRTS